MSNSDDMWRKAKAGICPSCNRKSLRQYKNFVTCDNCNGTPMECNGSVCIVVDPHPEDPTITCPRCLETDLGPHNGHMLFCVQL